MRAKRTFFRTVLAAAAMGAAMLATGCISQQTYSELQDQATDLQYAKRNLEEENSRLRKIADRVVLTEVERAELERFRQTVDWRKHRFQKEMVEGDYLVLSDVSFRPGKDVLSAQGMKVLDRVAQVLTRKVRLGHLAIEGHSDSQPLRATAGKYLNNWDLSARRALRVQIYLKKKGVPIEKTYIVGYGPTLPREAGKHSLNRRVELKGYRASATARE